MQPFASVTSLIYIVHHESVYRSEIFHFQYHLNALLDEMAVVEGTIVVLSANLRGMYATLDYIEILSDLNLDGSNACVILQTSHCIFS